MRMPIVASVLLLLVIAPLSSTTAQFGPPASETASVGISPNYVEAAPGEVLTFTVVGSSTLGGAVLINIGSGLVLFGSATCSGPCGGPYQSQNSGQTTIEVHLDGNRVVVSIPVLVSSTARAGDVFGIGVTLVGGPQAVEMAASTISVRQDILPPTASADNRMMFVEASPVMFRLAPGGEILYHIQPARWGMWSTSPTIRLEITVPSLLVASSPSCGRGQFIPNVSVCETVESATNHEQTVYSIIPGYNDTDGSANGVYLSLRAGREVEVGSELKIEVSASVDDSTLASQPEPVITSVRIVSVDDLLTPQWDPTSNGAVLELAQGFIISGTTCESLRDPSAPQYGLYTMGLESRIAVGILGVGRVDSSLDGLGRQVCLVPLEFYPVTGNDLSLLATAYGQDLPCRACVLGVITTGNGAEIVFPV